uniref:Uncharacterized protein n=1 Tax=Utricularia reniformis TaxID=192314 RepID=A0A1Y0B0V1_9LAMI|nr:hypothetical protein AEK19_MT0758 [Utricularia reniformis]ART31001.1 hypothetical protein AEK19_MT0758 [Utricularia reniformis]
MFYLNLLTFLKSSSKAYSHLFTLDGGTQSSAIPALVKEKSSIGFQERNSLGSEGEEHYSLSYLPTSLTANSSRLVAYLLPSVT